VAYGVEITARAERDLADIYRRIQAETSPLAAKWFNGMARAMSSLDRYPKRAPIAPENRALRHLLYGKKPYVYRIIFKIDEENSTVYILHIRPPRREKMKER
jgi:mRNA-degrading endonuclease RelE of RelBE toxin-antitoxin system